MAKVFPFQGEVYNQELVNPALCVTPPYDVISKEKQNEYYEQSPYNIIRLILPREDNKYERAKQTLDLWKRKHILKRDEKAYFYLYEQEWEHFEDKGIFRGIIASLSLCDYNEKIIFPHEKVLSEQKEDRLRLLSTCKTNFSPILLIYSDNGDVKPHITTSNPPFIEFEYKKGLFCRLFRLNKTKEIKKALEGKRLFIADGHHRYDASLTYFKETKNPKMKRTMVLIASIEYGGFIILPTHRIVKNPPNMKRLKKYFNLQKTEKDKIFSALYKRKEIGVFGMLFKNFSYIISLKDVSLLNTINEALRTQDVSILHELLFNGGELERGIEYTTDRDVVFKRVMENDCLFILRPANVFDVIKIASLGYRMPGKATYFYPKPFCGLVIHPLR